MSEDNTKEYIINIQDMTISHDDGVLLSNVNLKLEAGEFAYLIGKSGAGKTSFLRTLYNDYPIDEGEVEVCGFDLMTIKNRQVPSLRRKIGIVFQNARLLADRNVYDNLYFVLRATGWKNKAEIDERIMETLEMVKMADRATANPLKLSEGERQRIGIARALINKPDLIVADEPTGNLDPMTSSEIMGLLHEINKTQNTAMLISTHDFMMIDKYQSRVVVCENGTLVDPQ
ncbi:MAG: ATP-binding cassette domain-containing protein [Bacteroidales bacterium]|nr:ATP-binding cassette domain-containing protein [Bacteroidales bacterium]